MRRQGLVLVVLVAAVVEVVVVVVSSSESDDETEVALDASERAGVDEKTSGEDETGDETMPGMARTGVTGADEGWC